MRTQAQSGQESLATVAAARAGFLGGVTTDPAVDEVVVASWRRAQSAGLDADDYRVEYDGDIELDSRLARCAQPILAKLYDDMSSVPVAIALSDAKARIVDRRDCSTSVGRLLDRVEFLPGASFAEGGVGTNGIGTVFEAGTPVSVVGHEHFNAALVPFACTGAPVLDPITGRMEGVLDVSLLAESWTPLIHTLVRSAAAEIGRSLLLDRSAAQQALFEAYLRADTRSRQAVMAIGDTVMVNRLAQALLSPDEQFAVHEHARFLMARRDRASGLIPLGSGRSLRFRGTRVPCGPSVAGVVLLLEEHREELAAPGTMTALSAAPRSRPATTGETSTCAAWNQAGAEVLDALARRRPLLVLGEGGTGKCTLVGDLFRRQCPDGERVQLEAATAAAAVPDLPGLLGHDPGTPTLVVLRHLDRVPPAGTAALATLVGRLAGAPGVHLVATADEAAVTDGPRDPATAAVLGHFAQSVSVPPLRFRAGDLPGLVTSMLHDLAPERRARISAEAVRLLRAHPWPGNLWGLREALRAALAHRPAGELQAEDLPGSCRTGTRRVLTPIEVAERDTILRALHDSGGNRVHAAASLGMSRSSLYRKLRAYAVTEA